VSYTVFSQGMKYNLEGLENKPVETAYRLEDQHSTSSRSRNLSLFTSTSV
jgi:hypothetical protein